jgi:hypothetical protein
MDVSCSIDAVSFSALRLNPVFLQENAKKNSGLQNEESLVQALKNGDYVTVLKAIWGERDRERCLMWLRKNSGTLHAPILYELALEEFKASPCVETVVRVSFPLIRAATFRVRQDGICFEDASIALSDILMDNVYSRSLRYLMKEKGIPVILESESKGYCLGTILSVAKKSLTQLLPSPMWVQRHGIGYSYQKRAESPDVITLQQIRAGYAEQTIESIILS